MSEELKVSDVIAFLGDNAEEIAEYLIWALDNPLDAKREIIIGSEE